MVIGGALVAALAVGGTMAWFTATDSATNTFTVGNVTIDVPEPSWNPDTTTQVVPEDTYAKDPYVTLEAGSADSYAFIVVETPQVTLTDGTASGGKTTTGNFAEIGEGEDDAFVANKLGDGWVKVGALNDYTEDGITYKRAVYAYGTASAMTKLTGAKNADVKTATPLFTDVKINMLDQSANAGKSYSINVKGYAIQAEGIETAKGTTAVSASDVWTVLATDMSTSTGATVGNLQLVLDE